MKSQFFAAMIGAALALPMVAQAEGAYIGANVGRSELKSSPPGAATEKYKETSYKLYAGYDFTKNFGAEAGYVHFGNSDGRTGIGTFSAKPSAFYAAATGNLPLNEQCSLFAKAGISANRIKVDYSEPGFSESTKENKTSVLFGIGAAYHFDKKISLVAEYENFGKMMSNNNTSVKADLLSIGLRYKF